MSMLRSDTAFPRAHPLQESGEQAIGPIALEGPSALHTLQSRGELSSLSDMQEDGTCHSSRSSQML